MADYKLPNLEVADLLQKFSTQPEYFLDYFKNSSLLIGLLVNSESKKLVSYKNNNYSAMAAFSSEIELLAFSDKARASILTGCEIAEIALKSPNKLLVVNPPSGVILTGGMLKAIVGKSDWKNPILDENLKNLIANFFKDYPDLTYELKRGNWTDAEILLSGNLALAHEAASKLGRFLTQERLANQLLPSGADIVYLPS